MKALLSLLVLGVLFGCAEPQKKVVQLESSRAVALSGKAILFNKDKDKEPF